jgi:hypothetical protein
MAGFLETYETWILVGGHYIPLRLNTIGKV